MNLVQLAEHAKNFSNQQLQQMLQQPDGSIPPFILAAEAARRQDIERSAQMQPSQPTTVLDDLIQERSTKAGVPQLPAQMNAAQQPQAARGGGLMALAGGGQVRGFAGGSVAVAQPGTARPPMPTFSDIAAGLGEDWNSAVDWAKQKYDIISAPQQVGISGATDPFVRQNAGLGPAQPSGGMTSEEMTADINRYRREVAGGYPKTPVDPKAVEKNIKTAEKEAAMGATPTASAEPTTGNSADAAKIRAQIESLYGPQDDDYILGISPTAYAGIAQAMLSREPGLSSGERWAAASMALARGQQAKQEQEDELRREGAMALINWDAKQMETARQEQREDIRYQREKADADARAEAAANKEIMSRRISGLEVYARAAKDKADFYQDQIDQITKQYEGMFGQMPEEDKLKIAQLESARNEQMGIYEGYQEQLGSGVYGIPKIGTTDPQTGRPTS